MWLIIGLSTRWRVGADVFFSYFARVLGEGKFRSTEGDPQVASLTVSLSPRDRKQT